MGRRAKRRRPPAEQRFQGAGGEGGGIREELLASLIAGTLGPVQRLEAARYLVTSQDAREIFQMAYLALISGRRPQGL